MMELIKAYFEKHDYVNLILSIDPVTENGEQCYEVWYENPCVATGEDFVTVTNSELLVFLHNGKVGYSNE